MCDFRRRLHRMTIRNIKMWFCMACLASSMAAPSQPSLALDIIDMAAISRMSPHQLEMLAEGLAAEEIMRTKRSSAQALTSVVSKASSGLQSKVGFLGQASAGAASFIASASSKSGHTDEHPGYSYEPHADKVDFWGLKKSILYTLFQAVKAITGGVTILKGQLIKGGGHLATTLGKVIAVKGESVSNLGKKIVSSAALSAKKPHSTAVYGPPPTHVDYPPSAYGAPTAPAHFSHTAPSAPTGYASHKFPAHLDGRGKLNGVHAGLVILTPLGDAAPSESHSHSGHTVLDPPPSILNTVYSAIKNAFASPPAITEEATYQPPPPPPQIPSFKPMTWGAVNSYGEPASIDAYPDYDPRNPHPPFDYASSKLSVVPPKRQHHHIKQGLTSDKIQKINHNLGKLAAYMNENVQRSSEDLPKFIGLDAYREMMGKHMIPLLPTPVVTDNEIGVLPADLLPTDLLPNDILPTDPMTTTTTTTTTSTEKPATTTENEQKRERKDVKYYLRGNKIIVHG